VLVDDDGVGHVPHHDLRELHLARGTAPALNNNTGLGFSVCVCVCVCVCVPS
jgi:hypothetical protein